MKKLSKIFKRHWPIIVVIGLFVIVRVVTIAHHTQANWDAVVYVGMGKYLFSHGTIGTWELIRPVGLPIILGTLWLLGFNPYTAGIVLSITVSVLVLILVYLFAEEARKGAGPIAALLLATSALFFSLSSVPVSDIISSFFALWSLWLTYKAEKNWQYCMVGIVAALAMMFRFPQGLALAVAGIVIIKKIYFGKVSPDRIISAIKHLCMLGAGFAVIVLPYLASNIYVYHNPFLPFTEATAVIKQYPSLYRLGTWYYWKQLPKINFLYLFALVPLAVVWKKKYRLKVIMTVGVAVVIFGAYFSYESHKELRYILAFLPYLAVLAGVGIAYVLEWIAVPKLAFYGLYAIAGFMIGVSFLRFYHDPNNDPMYYFNSYLAKASAGAHVLTATPTILAYSDVLITRNLYSDWNDAYAAYNTYKNNNEYIVLDSCNFEIGCADNAQCKDKKQALLDQLNKEDTNVFYTVTPSQCALSIYKINH